jgi:hypothetical protein
MDEDLQALIAYRVQRAAELMEEARLMQNADHSGDRKFVKCRCPGPGLRRHRTHGSHDCPGAHRFYERLSYNQTGW